MIITLSIPSIFGMTSPVVGITATRGGSLPDGPADDKKVTTNM
jgi:hypothetical protein